MQWISNKLEELLPCIDEAMVKFNLH